jgi:small subunit ribosomal protein S2
MAVVSMRQLLEAGVHFGHQTRRWNPKMKRFILGERNGIYLIDLRKTLTGVESAYSYVRDLVAGGGTILFVGTKKQTQGPVAEYAEACGMPFVNQRWLGGMLTNFSTVSGRVKRMQELRTMEAAGDFEGMPKREALQHTRELEKLSRNLGGIANLERLPNAIFVIDTKKEHIAVTEARKLGLPVVAVVDTNCDPDVIDYVIPGNDDAIRSGSLMCRVLADAVVEGRFIAEHRRKNAPPPAEETRPPGPHLGPDACPPPPAAPPTGVAEAPTADAPSHRPRCGRFEEPQAPVETELAEVATARGGGLSMPNFTAKDIQRLRQATGAGMLDCKKALEEADGDYDAALQNLRAQGSGRRGQAGRP